MIQMVLQSPVMVNTFASAEPGAQEAADGCDRHDDAEQRCQRSPGRRI